MSRDATRQIAKATAITGSAQVVAIACGFGRAKAAAIFAGVAGVGALGLYTAAVNLLSAVSSLGLGSSAVRDVAAANATGDAEKIAKTIHALRRLTLLTGLLGCSLCVLGAPLLSLWTFGEPGHEWAFRVLGLHVLFLQVSAGQGALLRGLRRIHQLAGQTIVTSIVSLLGATLAYWLLAEQGIVPAILISGLTTVAGTWWFARKVPIERHVLSWTETLRHGGDMMQMGAAFMFSNIITTAASYVIGVFIFQHGGAHENGVYQAAWVMTGAVAGVVIGAMGQDYYPRLSSAPDECTVNLMANNQISTGLALSLPGLLLMSSLAAWLVPFFFSLDFSESVSAIPWFVIGAFGKTLSYPLGYCLIAKDNPRSFAASELAMVLINLILVFCLVPIYGALGAAFSYAGLYAIHILLMRYMVGRLTGFKFSPRVIASGSLGYASLITTAFYPFFGIACACVAGIYTWKILQPRRKITIK